MARYFGGMLVNERNQILVRRPRNMYHGYSWTFAKGGRKKDETDEQAALREVLEETGFTAEIVREIGSFKGENSFTKYYLMKPAGAPRAFEAKETEAVQWVDPERARSMIMETTNEAGRNRDLEVLEATIRMISRDEMNNEKYKLDDGFYHWAHVKELPKDKWQCFIRDVSILFENLPSTHNGKPLNITENTVNEYHVLFNGDHPLGFQSFYLPRERIVGGASDSEGCRTAHYPYELAVQVCLLLYRYHFRRLVGISSSANTMKQWKEAIKFVKNVFHLDVIPIRELSFSVIDEINEKQY